MERVTVALGKHRFEAAPVLVNITIEYDVQVIPFLRIVPKPHAAKVDARIAVVLHQGTRRKSRAQEILESDCGQSNRRHGRFSSHAGDPVVLMGTAHHKIWCHSENR